MKNILIECISVTAPQLGLAKQPPFYYAHGICMSGIQTGQSRNGFLFSTVSGPSAGKI